ALHDFGGRRDGIAGRESRSGGQCAFAASVIAIEKVSAGQNSGWISVHLGPPRRLPVGSPPQRERLFPWLPPPACGRRWRSRGSTCRINRSHCTFPDESSKGCDIPWN